MNDQASTISAGNWLPGSGLGPRVQAVGRLIPNVSLETARAEIETIRTVLKGQGVPQAAWYRGKRELVMMALRDRVLGNSRLALLTLWSAAGFVLLIACVNVANLLFARAAARRHETAVRVALGVNRVGLVRQLLTESTMLAFLGGLGGVVLAHAVIRFIARFGPPEIPQLRDAVLNSKVLIFTFVACLGTGVISGVAPAVEGSRNEPIETLKQGGRTSYGYQRHRIHALLVISELVLSLVLLSGAGLMLKSIWVMRSQVAAISPEHVLTTNLNVRALPVSDQEPYVAGLATQIEALPGVRAVTVIGGGRTQVGFVGLPAPPSDKQVLFELVTVTPHFPAAMQSRLISGRWLGDADSAQSPHVMAVNEVAAHLFSNLYPSSGPIIGRQLEVGGQPYYTVVGIVSGFPRKLDAEQAPQLFIMHWQWPREGVGAVLIRTSSDSAAIANSVRAIMRRSPRIEVKRVETLDEQMTEGIAPRRFQAGLLAAFAFLAVLLSMIGVYGVLSNSVTASTHDIGVRMALGARRTAVLTMVLGHAARLVGAGLAVGLIAALGLTRLMSSLIYGVRSSDPWTYSIVSLLLISVAALAAYLPARRAVRVDPLVSLRYE
jgi:predicted permease